MTLKVIKERWFLRLPSRSRPVTSRYLEPILPASPVRPLAQPSFVQELFPTPSLFLVFVGQSVFGGSLFLLALFILACFLLLSTSSLAFFSAGHHVASDYPTLICLLAHSPLFSASPAAGNTSLARVMR